MSNRYMMVFEGSNASSRPAGSAGTREVDTRAATMRERFGSAGAMTAGILRRGPGDLLNSPADETRCLLELQEKNIWREVVSVGVVCDDGRGEPRKIGDNRVSGGAENNSAGRSRGWSPCDARVSHVTYAEIREG